MDACYKVTSYDGSAVSFDKVRGMCSGTSALAMPKTKSEVDAIVAAACDTGNILIGLTCDSGCQQKANWKFLDGSSPGSDFPWESNQPNGKGAAQTGCAVIRGISSGENDVNDVSCLNTYTKQFACQRPCATTEAPLALLEEPQIPW